MSPRLFVAGSVLAFGFLSGCGSTREYEPLPQPRDTVPAIERVTEPAPEPYESEPVVEPAADPLEGVPAPGREQNRWVQTRLNALGYGCGDVDGHVGPATRACIQAFRVDNGLSDTPDVDDDLLILLNTLD